MVAICIRMYIINVDLFEFGGLSIRLNVFLVWLVLFNGLKVSGLLPWLKKVRLGLLVFLLCL